MTRAMGEGERPTRPAVLGWGREEAGPRCQGLWARGVLGFDPAFPHQTRGPWIGRSLPPRPPSPGPGSAHPPPDPAVPQPGLPAGGRGAQLPAQHLLRLPDHSVRGLPGGRCLREHLPQHRPGGQYQPEGLWAAPRGVMGPKPHPCPHLPRPVTGTGNLPWRPPVSPTPWESPCQDSWSSLCTTSSANSPDTGLLGTQDTLTRAHTDQQAGQSPAHSPQPTHELCPQASRTAGGWVVQKCRDPWTSS